jgi:uncharacterized protein YjbJ (UPF0337 family)
MKPMNWEQVEGKWKQLKGSAKTRWGKLTDSDLDVVNGRREQLVGLIQQHYGIAKEAAEKQVNEWGASAVSTSGAEPHRKVG